MENMGGMVETEMLIEFAETRIFKIMRDNIEKLRMPALNFSKTELETAWQIIEQTKQQLITNMKTKPYVFENSEIIVSKANKQLEEIINAKYTKYINEQKKFWVEHGGSF